jgi:hypothetical protein
MLYIMFDLSVCLDLRGYQGYKIGVTLDKVMGSASAFLIRL